MSPPAVPPDPSRNALLMADPHPQKIPATAGQTLRALTGRDYLSPSALRTYLACPLQFAFEYVDERPRAFVPASLAFGSAIHAAVQAHYVARFQAEPAPTLEALIVIYDQVWRGEATDPVRFGPKETPASLRDLAGRLLEAFRASDAARWDTGLLAVEEEFRGAIVPGCPDLLGRVDLVVQAGPVLRVVDFKTSRSAWSPSKTLDSALQMLLYHDLVRPLADPGTPLELTWCVLTKTRRPRVELQRLTYGEGDLRRARAMVRGVWRAIRDRHFYPAPSGGRCPSCPYATPCREWEAQEAPATCGD